MISVLLPFRNAAPTLRQAAESVLTDMRAVDELVLVDDGSTDEGPVIASALATTDDRIRIVRCGGEGLAAALSRGLSACRGEWIARMDADDVSLAGRLECERHMLEHDSSLAVVATCVEVFGAPGDGIERYVAWQNSVISPLEHARSVFIEAPVCHPSTMIRRSALESVGGFRAGPFPEDYDLWLRLLAAGHRMAKVPRVLFRWRVHEQMTTKRDPRMSLEAIRRLRAEHLARWLGGRVFLIWGAGPAGRRLARELEVWGARASRFIDIDPKKIGRTRRGARISDPDEGLERARAEGALVVVAVAARGARDQVRHHLLARRFIEGEDFVCAS